MLTALSASVPAGGASGGFAHALKPFLAPVPLLGFAFLLVDLAVLWHIRPRPSAGRPDSAAELQAPGGASIAPRTGGTAPQAPGGRPRLRVPVADGLRGLACVLVIACHVAYFTGYPRLGTEGVRDFVMSGFLSADFFFVLSGFVLFLPVVTSGGTFGNKGSYALRRAARILPAYYVALAATIALVPVFTRLPIALPFNSPKGWWSLLLHLSFLQHSVGVALGYPEGFAINGVMWTLAVEAIFYLVLPLVAVAYFRRPFVGLAVALGLSTAWKYAVLHNTITLRTSGIPSAGMAHTLLGSQFPTYAADFAAGMTAAWIFIKIKDKAVPRAAWVLAEAASLVALGWAMERAGHRDAYGLARAFDHWSMTLPAVLLFAVLLVSTALAPRWASFAFDNWVARRLGEISYGMYLWHLLFLTFALTVLHFPRTTTLASFARLGAFALGGAVLAGIVSHVVIEQPFVRWARRRTQERAGRNAPAALPAPAGPQPAAGLPFGDGPPTPGLAHRGAPALVARSPADV